MSNHLAIAAVTASLTTLVQTAADTAGITPGPRVSASNLQDNGDHARIVVHLLRVSRNAAWSSQNLPTRSSGGGFMARPAAALDLHYLIAFRADTDFDAHNLLAVTAAELEAWPTLSPDLLTTAEAVFPSIGGNDLRQAPEPVRFSPDTVDQDALLRVWSLYTVGTFAPTIGVVAGPVIVESPVTPSGGVPVSRISLGAEPLRILRLDAVGGPSGPGAPVRSTTPPATLTLAGAGFRRAQDETVDLILDGGAVAATVVDDGQITATVGALAPGQHRIQVRRTAPPLDPTLSSTSQVQLSEARAFLVLPTLSSAIMVAGKVKVTVIPAVSNAHQVHVLLDPTAPTGSSLRLDPTLTAAPTGTFEVDPSGAPAGTYIVTIEVDGARSLPPTDVAGRYVQTTVTL
ncbi:MAG: DUF4255 domain-containing protein [Marmoricola sp.]